MGKFTSCHNDVKCKQRIITDEYKKFNSFAECGAFLKAKLACVRMFYNSADISEFEYLS